MKHVATLPCDIFKAMTSSGQWLVLHYPVCTVCWCGFAVVDSSWWSAQIRCNTFTDRPTYSIWGNWMERKCNWCNPLIHWSVLHYCSNISAV